MSLLLLEKVEVSTRLNDQLCRLTHGLFHLLSFPSEIISSSKEGKKKPVYFFCRMKRKEHRGKEERSKKTFQITKPDQNNKNKPTMG